MDNRKVFFIATALILGLVGLHYETLWSMISIWERSETFAHGYLIFPISIYLIWSKRDELIQYSPQPSVSGIPVILLLGLLWLVSSFVDVQVIQQYAFVAMIPVSIFTLFGLEITRAIIFPLFFMIFAVPFGEFLIAPMMNLTAIATVTAVKWSGIPVYVEGTFLTLPSGKWSVVEGCSGIRYLIASITLGCLYVYLMYRSFWRRTVFMLLFILIPIIGNWLRAYMIVMIGHVSDMKLATGVDHILYGWVFFGIVIGILFFVGLIWREDHEPVSAPRNTRSPSLKSGNVSATKFYVVSITLVFSIVIWPYALGLMTADVKSDYSVNINAPSGSGGWSIAKPQESDWTPRYIGADKELSLLYMKDNNEVGAFIEYYYRQEQDRELVNSQNVMVRQKHPVWRNVGEKNVQLNLNGNMVEIVQTTLKSPNRNLLVWHWYWLDGQRTTNSYLAKLTEAKNKLMQQTKGAAAIIVYTEFGENTAPAESTLQAFLSDMMGPLEKELERAEIR